MNVKGIVKEYLKNNKYDGLYNPDSDCACGIDDLYPCGGEWIDKCEPGYQVPCDCGDHDYHIQGNKEASDEDEKG